MLTSSSLIVTRGAHVYRFIFHLKLDKTSKKRVFLTPISRPKFCMETWITQWVLTFTPPCIFKKSFSRWLWGAANVDGKLPGGVLGSGYVILVVQIRFRVGMSVCSRLRPASVGDYSVFGWCRVLLLIIAIDHSFIVLVLGMLAGFIRVKQGCFGGQMWVFFDSSKCFFCGFSLKQLFPPPFDIILPSWPHFHTFGNAGTNFHTH
jgi:hypothetical protein